MRETWFIKNIYSRELTISDLDKAPAIKPNETIDALRYHTKQEIEQSESLRDAIDRGYIQLIKRRDNTTVVKRTPNDINISIENAEIDESVRYYGEIHAHLINKTITIATKDVYVQIDGDLERGSENGLVFQNARELRVVIPGSYLAQWSLTFLTAAGGGQEISGAIMKNSVRLMNGTIHTTTVAAGKGVSASGGAILPGLVAGDLISLAVTNETLATDIIIDDLNFIMLRIDN